MSFVLKISFNDDIRRVTLGRTNFLEFSKLIKDMFGLHNKEVVFKYTDEENDLVTVTSTLELNEAVSTSKNLLRMFVSEKAPSNAQQKQAEQPKSAPGGDFIQYLDPETLLATVTVTPDTIGDVLSLLQKLGVNPATDKSVKELSESVPQLQQLLGANLPPTNDGKPEESVHNGVACDVCGQAPIRGTRYKCGECFNYDLCSACEEKGAHDPSHPRLKMTQPRTRTTCPRMGSSARQYRGCKRGPVHAGIICDGCRVSPITGDRFKCTVCPDFDLCESCNANGGAHDPTHRMELVQPATTWRHPAVVPTGRGCPYRYTVNKDSDTQDKYSAAMVSVSGADDVTLISGSALSKNWKVRNDGTVSWPENTTLSFVYGDDNIGVPRSLFVGPINPGEEVELVAEITAPAVSGKYSSYWRLCSGDGLYFGPPFWVRINVEPAPVPEEAPVVPAPVEEPAPAIVVPVPAAAPAPVEVPAPVEIPAPAVVSAPDDDSDEDEDEGEVVEEFVVTSVMSEEEAMAVMLIQGMGFHGQENILTCLRINDGDVESTVNALLG